MGTVRPTVLAADLQALRRMIQQAPGRVSRRAQAVVWWLVGESQTAVSRRLGVSRQSVQAWCTRFRRSGVAGLWDRPRSGRPARTGTVVREAVARCLRASDVAGTTGPGGWTMGRLLAALGQQGIAASAQTVRRVLDQLQARWRRGRPVTRGDPDRWLVLAQLADGLLAAELAARQAGRRLVVLFEDEADLALLAHAGYSWQLPGSSPVIPTPGQNQKIGLVGTISLDGEVLVQEVARKTAVALVGYLEQVVARDADAEIALIWDNVGIHHARATQAWLRAHPAVHVLWLPRYSPNDNAQERVWRWLREAVCHNRAYPDLASKRATAQTFFATLEPADARRRCVPDRLLAGLLAAVLTEGATG
jgi:transposase